MKTFQLIRKAAFLIGCAIIALSVLIFLISGFNAISTVIKYLVNSFSYQGIESTYSFANYLSILISPFSGLISGLGFGGILALLSLMLDAEKASAFLDDLRKKKQ